MSHPLIVWTVSGSDSGGGAGLQADLRALAAQHVHGCTAVAAITAQNSVAVERIAPVDPELLKAQLEALASDLPPAAIKTGMLGSAANLRVLVSMVDRLREHHPQLPLVVDPVLAASTGVDFANAELVRAYRELLLPRTSLLTPNRAEAARLLGWPALETPEAVQQAAQALRDLGVDTVVITGGDSGDAAHSLDHLQSRWAQGWLSLPRLPGHNNHGTGCVFASSAAAAMARGFVATDAAVIAKMATHRALQQAYVAGKGAGPVAPQSGFALQRANLPGLHPEYLPRGLRFAPLSNSDLGLYAVVDSADWLQRVLDAGVRTVQLRVKDVEHLHEHAHLREQVRQSIAAARKVGAQLFINDHWQMAIDEGAYGVHLGQEDLATADLAAIARAGLRLGVSTHCYWEVCRAWALQPSYVACGPIHPTGAKAMPWIAQGDDNLAYWCHLLGLPVVAIGGIDVDRAEHAARCGAAGIAVISAITAAAEPEQAVQDLRQAIARGRAALRWSVPEMARPTLG